MARRSPSAVGESLGLLTKVDIEYVGRLFEDGRELVRRYPGDEDPAQVLGDRMRRPPVAEDDHQVVAVQVDVAGQVVGSLAPVQQPVTLRQIRLAGHGERVQPPEDVLRIAPRERIRTDVTVPDLGERRGAWSEYAARRLIDAAGVPTVPAALVTSAEEAVTAAEALPAPMPPLIEATILPPLAAMMPASGKLPMPVLQRPV